jgi:hypothetical protein
LDIEDAEFLVDALNRAINDFSSSRAAEPARSGSPNAFEQVPLLE